MTNPLTIRLKNAVAVWLESTTPPPARHLPHHPKQSMRTPPPNQKKKCNLDSHGGQSYETARQSSHHDNKRTSHTQLPTSRETESYMIKRTSCSRK